jgi:hypothetical protein
VPTILKRHNLPERRDHRALALGLLEAHPGLLRAARSEHDRARIRHALEPPADGGHALAVTPGGAQRSVQLCVEKRAVLLR